MSVRPQLFLPLVEQFGDPEANGIFTAEAYLAACIEVEVALAHAQAAVGVVPLAAAEAIAAAAALVEHESAGLWEEARTVGYPILPLVQRLAAAAGEAGAYVHWGATTQDIMDTALVLQLRRARARARELLYGVAAEAARLAEEYAETPMAGRTHGQQAVPISFGFKCASWLDELARHCERLDELAPRLLRVQLAGAAGTLASLGPQGPAVRAALADQLGLADPELPWHSARDTLAELAAVLAGTAATAVRVARELTNLARTEIGEVSEAAGHLRGASSTMPQKRNPVGSEAAIGLGNLAIAVASALPRAMQGEHERSAGEWQIEWDAIPLVCAATAGALLRLRDVLRGLVVDTERMGANLRLDPAIMSEALMMALAPTLGRQRSHDLVYELAQRAVTTRTPLAELVAATAELAPVLERIDLQAVLVPEAYLGEAPAAARRAVKRWRAAAAAAE